MDEGLGKRSARQRQRYHESSEEDTEVSPRYRETNNKLKAEALEEQEAMDENYVEESKISEDSSSQVENLQSKKTKNGKAAKALQSEASEAVPTLSVAYEVEPGPAGLVINGHKVEFGNSLPSEVAMMFPSISSLFGIEWSFSCEYCETPLRPLSTSLKRHLTRAHKNVFKKGTETLLQIIKKWKVVKSSGHVIWPKASRISGKEDDLEYQGGLFRHARSAAKPLK